ncbi:MAG: sulfatase [Myxococcales bacterium]|nr:sulfatase [Myxococcales bacterium]
MPSRPRPTAAALALVIAALLGGVACAERPPRHLVLVVVDTLRADRLGVYGHERATSPELARWAERGALFERAFATSPWTLPSFASLLTGLPPARHGAGSALRGNVARVQHDRNPLLGMRLHGEERWFLGLDPSVPTLAERLRQAGFETAAFVNNPFLSRGFGLARGFDHWDHEPGGDLVSRRADEMVDRFLAWRDASDAERSFTLLHLFDPHMSYDAPPPFAGRFRGADSSGSPSARFEGPVRSTPAVRAAAPGLAPADRAAIAAAYDEELAFVDAQLGRLLDALEARGALREGLVVLTADHGEELFEHGGFGHGHAMHDELLRVPLLFWGGALVPGRRDTPVSIADLPATLLDAVGLDPPEAGVSLWPLLAGQGPPQAPRTLLAENPGSDDDAVAAIDWPYKLVRARASGREALYDLEADPGESADRAAQHPEVRRRLAEALDALSAQTGGEGRPVELDPDTRERLRGLGYLE